MSLNIKNERVHELARRAAHLSGKTQTAAIEVALERFIAECEVDPEVTRQHRLDLLWREIQTGTTDAEREVTRKIMDELYDEVGLPQ